MKKTKTDDITPQQARLAFKNWDVQQQRKFLNGLLEEHAYSVGMEMSPNDDNFVLRLEGRYAITRENGKVNAVGRVWFND